MLSFYLELIVLGVEIAFCSKLQIHDIDSLMQKKPNSIADAQELRLVCIKPSNCTWLRYYVVWYR